MVEADRRLIKMQPLHSLWTRPSLDSISAPRYDWSCTWPVQMERKNSGLPIEESAPSASTCMRLHISLVVDTCCAVCSNEGITMTRLGSLTKLPSVLGSLYNTSHSSMCWMLVCHRKGLLSCSVILLWFQLSVWLYIQCIKTDTHYHNAYLSIFPCSSGDTSF